MSNSDSTDTIGSDLQISQLRSIILGKNSHIVTDIVKKDARHIVGDVLTEALNDRQKQDGSVNKVLLPLVEKSVEYSVAHHSDKLVSSLYPLMGRLVRKSVTAFLTDFMEKTNQLIENSFTFKGLKWRFIAWQSDISFSEYVASQIFLYRVEHVFLIHRETGLLLKSVNSVSQNNQDADLISSMLTAINDFVGDSFSIDEGGLKEQLQTVSTDTFNLLIKPGPNALVVAAVIGNPPQKVNDQLQLTLEDIHSLFDNELNDFSGDNEPFQNSENLLQDCLLSEQKNTEETSANKPWFAWIMIFLVVIFIGFQMFKSWTNNQLAAKITLIENQPGIIVKSLNVVDVNTIELHILRDPSAILVTDWLNDNDLIINNLNLTEHQYYSLDPDILYARAQKTLSEYPKITALRTNNTLVLSGFISFFKMEKLLKSLEINGYKTGINLVTTSLKLDNQDATLTSIDSKKIKIQLFNTLIERISVMKLDFDLGSDNVTLPMKIQIKHLYSYVNQLKELASELDISFGLIVIGCSDNSGNKEINEVISLNRANNVSKILHDLGLDEKLMYVTGLGQIDIETINTSARKVIFNVIHVKSKA